jgi:hypothetical protein
VPTLSEHNPNNQQSFQLHSAVASGVFVKFSVDHQLDLDLPPQAEDFSLSLPICEGGDTGTLRPLHAELKADKHDRQATRLILVFDQPLPPVSEVEVHYHPQEVLLWSNTIDDSIAPFITTVPIKLSREHADTTLSTKLLEKLSRSTEREPAPEQPPSIIAMTDTSITISTNRRLIPHQGVAVGDLRAETTGDWRTITAAAVRESSSDEPHEIHLALKETTEPGEQITVVFKAKRYPLTALDGSQISYFSLSVRYLGEGKFDPIDANLDKPSVQAKAPEQFHMQALETMSIDAVTNRQIYLGYLVNLWQSAVGFFGQPLASKSVSESVIKVSRTQKLMLIGLALVIIWLALAGARLLSSFSNTQTNSGNNNQSQVTQASKPVDLGSVENCTLNYPSGNRYTGTCNTDQQPHGNGIFQWRSGSTYDGDFINGKRHGLGFMTYKGGAKYDGNWANDRKQGYGTYWNTQGDRYEGKFANGKMTVDGVCTKRDGTQVTGFCAN